jgi:hypothetical protein
LRGNALWRRWLVVKIWIATTRKELALITQAARKLGVTVSVSQFVRGEIKLRVEKSPKIPPRSAAGPVSTNPRKRKL